MPRRTLVLAIATLAAVLAAATGACTSKHLDNLAVQSLIISPRTAIIRAAQTVDFTVTATNISDPASYTCTLNSSAVGTVSKTTAGCRLVVATPAVGGTLYARIGLVADSALLTVTNVR